MRLTVLALGVMVLLPARAATVQVSVRERRGGPIERMRVTLVPIGPVEVPIWERQRLPSGYTGAGGKVTFESVAVGRYTVTLDFVSPPRINPAANPLAPPPQITIAAAGDKVAVEVEVWRGSLLYSEVIVDRATIPRDAKVVLKSLDGQPDVDLALDTQGRVEEALLPGRYEMSLAIPPGYLLVDIVWNGESLPGHAVRFDIREDPRRQSVSWYLSARSLVTGKVADASGACPVRVVATLVQPGSWIQAAMQRGGSSFQVVPHQEWVENRPCVYRLWLPDGRWTVQPQGDDLIGSEPASADITIAPGETRSLDFVLTTKESGAAKGQPLVVTVRDPEGRPLTGAAVEVWPAAEERSSEEPLRTGTTEGYGGSVTFRGLAAGDYLVAAGREDFLEGTAKVEAYDPKADEPTRVTVTLREGAKLHAHALDESDRPVRGVELRYTRLSPLPKIALAHEGLVTRQRQGSALTDVTGHVEIAALYEGDYRVEARMTGELSATRFVVVKQGAGKRAESVEVHLAERERTDVDLLVLPAASLSGGLVCSDRGTMSAKASFRVLPADAPLENPWSDEELESRATIAFRDVVLRGRGADRFNLGPLSPSAYRLAVRPEGQRYWSWASNELAPDRAAVFPIAEPATVDTGIVEIECGPLVMVLPGIKSKEPVPDLRLGAAHASLRPAGDEKSAHAVGVDVEPHADRVFLRKLTEGKFKAKLTLEHPYMVPPSISVPEQVLELTRGNVAEIRVAFDRLGGLLEVRGEGKAARLTPGEGAPVIRPVANGKADFPGTIPGTYRVELCGDPECSASTATWTKVSVIAGKTTFLP